ncbi:MAG: Uma2 family endonuclease [Actinomycetota bacterium]
MLSDPRHDRVRKRDLYARFGVDEYWIVDPDADRVEIHRLDQDTYGPPQILQPGNVLTLRMLPGFSLDISALFLS